MLLLLLYIAINNDKHDDTHGSRNLGSILGKTLLTPKAEPPPRAFEF